MRLKVNQLRRTAIAFIGLLAMLNGCGAANSGKPIRVVLPNGFNGPFEILVDEEHGADAEVDDGTLVFYVSDHGICSVRDDEPFTRWHVPMFVYRDGTNVSHLVTIIGAEAGSVSWDDVSTGKGITVSARHGSRRYFELKAPAP